MNSAQVEMVQGGRTDLYERSVGLLLNRWNEVRGIGGVKSVGERFGMEVREMRRALERLAYEIHQKRGGSEEDACDISDTELWRTLDRERSRERRVDERYVMDFLNQRSGILLSVSPTSYRFPHRSYQEDLAACHLSRTSFTELLLQEVKR